MTCVHCESETVVKRGTTGKDAQQYWCKNCETYFKDLTNTIFGQHRFELEEMFYMVKEMRSEPTDGRVRFIVCKDLQEADEEIAAYGDGNVILCTDGYSIYEDIEQKEGVDGHLAVTHSDTYVIGDAHANTCENPFASGWRTSEASRSIICRNISTSLH